jgi:UDP-glucose 4-epimerase
MVLPRFVEAALAGRKLTVHDDGRQIRCFAYVSDIVNLVLELMGNEESTGRVFNIGSDEPVEILDLARRVIRTADPTADVDSRTEFISYADAYSPDFEDCRHRVPDLSRLYETVNYRPKFGLDETIERVLAWKRGEMQS